MVVGTTASSSRTSLVEIWSPSQFRVPPMLLSLLGLKNHKTLSFESQYLSPDFPANGHAALAVEAKRTRTTASTTSREEEDAIAARRRRSCCAVASVVVDLIVARFFSL